MYVVYIAVKHVLIFWFLSVLRSSWKETLHTLEVIEGNTHKIAAGSYQNIYATEGWDYWAKSIHTNLHDIVHLYSHVLTWGAGKFGQLGNGQWQDSVQMQDIRSLVPPDSGQPVQVSAGCGHSGFITAKGHAFTCGDNRYSQLGIAQYSLVMWW